MNRTIGFNKEIKKEKNELKAYIFFLKNKIKAYTYALKIKQKEYEELELAIANAKVEYAAINKRIAKFSKLTEQAINEE